MSNSVDQHDSRLPTSDPLDRLTYSHDSLLGNIFGPDSGNQVISQYIDTDYSQTSQTLSNVDPYYAYSGHHDIDSPMESPLSANASLISSANNNDLLYQQDNDSFVQTVSTRWGSMSIHPSWDAMLTPTEVEQPSHLYFEGVTHSYKQPPQQHYFEPQFPTPTSATERMVIYTPVQPQSFTQQHEPSQEQPVHTQELHRETFTQFNQLQQQQYVQFHQSHQLPTPGEFYTDKHGDLNDVTTVTPGTTKEEEQQLVDEVKPEVILDEPIPQDSARRLESYLQRVKDVHFDDTTIQDTPTKPDKSQQVTDPEQTVTKKRKPLKVKKARRKRIAVEREGTSSFKTIVRGSASDNAVKEPYVPIVNTLRSNPVLWEKVQCMKKKGIYKCSHCPGVFNSLLDLAKHLDEFEVVRPYRCPFTDCPWNALRLPRRAEVRRHCAAQHAHIVKFGSEAHDVNEASSLGPSTMGQGAEKFECSSPLCTKRFKRKDACQRHFKLVHLNPDSRFNRRVDSLRDKYQTDDQEELMHLMKSTNSHK